MAATSSIFSAWLCARESVNRLFPHGLCIQAVGPNLSTTLRVKKTCRWAGAAGSKLRFGSANHLRKQSLGPSPVFWPSCHCARCPSPVSWEPSGAGLARETELFLPLQRPHLLTHVDSSHSTAHTIAQEVSPQSVSFGDVSQSTPPRFSANPTPTGARFPQARWACCQIVVCLSRPFLLVSPVSLLSSMLVLLFPHQPQAPSSSDPTLPDTWMILIGASAGPFCSS